MATYAIGDLQGCYQSFRCLLDKLQFNSDCDQLWLCGDLVNRGPESLKTLQLCFQMRDNLISVLGNHDLHMLAVMHGATKPKRKDTFDDILQFKQRDTLAEWLLECPLLFENEGWVITHAGIYPDWDLDTARRCAREVETVLRDNSLRQDFFNNMYGNQPDQWSEQLTGQERWRTITNLFTRMRLIAKDGAIDLSFKKSPEMAPKGLTPWYQWQQRRPLEKKVLFGHWAALEGNTQNSDIIALDTGCVWGNQLSAYCIETAVWTRCDCKKSS